MALGKKHEVSIKLEDYLHLIIGSKKIGKSSLVADIAEELYGGVNKLLILSLKNEKAYEAINGAVYEEPQTYQELMKHLKEFIAGGHEFRMLSIDTIDEFIEMVTEEVVRLHTIQYKEVPKSFNSCFGGYGAPRKKAQELINDVLDLIKDTPYGYYFVGHNKVKTIKSKLDESEYNVISSNLSEDYFNAIAYKCPIICNIVSEANTNEFKMGDKSQFTLNQKVRFMHFRDDAYIEAGSRFSELPQKVEYGAKEYIQAVTEGIKNSIAKRPIVESETPIKVVEQKQEVVAPKQEVAPEPTIVQNVAPTDITPAEYVQQIRAEFTRVMGNGKTQEEILGEMSMFGTTKPTEKTRKEILIKTLEGLQAM